MTNVGIIIAAVILGAGMFVSAWVVSTELRAGLTEIAKALKEDRE